MPPSDIPEQEWRFSAGTHCQPDCQLNSPVLLAGSLTKPRAPERNEIFLRRDGRLAILQTATRACVVLIPTCSIPRRLPPLSWRNACRRFARRESGKKCFSCSSRSNMCLTLTERLVRGCFSAFNRECPTISTVLSRSFQFFKADLNPVGWTTPSRSLGRGTSIVVPGRFCGTVAEGRGRGCCFQSRLFFFSACARACALRSVSYLVFPFPSIK